MKKYLIMFLALNLLISCSDKKDETVATQEEISQSAIAPTQIPPIDYAEKTFEFTKNTLALGCADDSEIICAINLTVKCSIDPSFSECNKKKMPKFVFMEDESIERPTTTSYKIIKLKPIADGQLEVYTQSQCDGVWFGLCNGNIIYVMEQREGQWAVKDLYAMQSINK